MAQQLHKIGWNGEAYVIAMNGAKDPNALHRQAPLRFKEAFQAALEQAQPLPLDEHERVEEGDEEKPPPPWPTLDDRALYGLAGDVVRTIGPHTEADDAAVLVQTLIDFGNVVGRQPHCMAEADYHALNENGVLVGATSKGRKGISAGHVRELFKRVAEAWVQQRIQTGLSSGEGLIWAVRDPLVKRQAVREKGKPTRESRGGGRPRCE
jgi:hypothetical protein